MKKLSTVILGISLLASSALFAQSNVSNDTSAQSGYLYPESGNNN